MVWLLGFRKKHTIEQADRDRRGRQGIVAAGRQLVDVHAAGIVNEPLDQTGINGNLHFHVQPTASIVAATDIEHDQFAFGKLLVTERVDWFAY